jgi:conserved oligomeric Golgi complex subunit 2
MALDVEDSDESRLLPVIEPLSHHTPLLDPIATESFNVDAFLLSRASHHSLPELRTELRDYLALLKSELVQLINDDYASFISLSTDLRGEGARLEHVKRPLRNIHAQIQVRETLLLAGIPD